MLLMKKSSNPNSKINHLELRKPNILRSILNKFCHDSMTIRISIITIFYQVLMPLLQYNEGPWKCWEPSKDIQRPSHGN